LPNVSRNGQQEWDNDGTLDAFAELTEDLLNVRIWQTCGQASKTFGSIVEKHPRCRRRFRTAVRKALYRVADAFAGTPADFVQGERDLELLCKLRHGRRGLREECRAYLGGSELTDVEEIETSR
jgi:hypothetical protein